MTLADYIAGPGCAAKVLLQLADLCVELSDEHEPDWTDRMSEALLERAAK